MKTLQRLWCEFWGDCWPAILGGNIVLILLLPLVHGCGPSPAPTCEYCRVPRSDAERYLCIKCSKSHMSCEIERYLIRYNNEASRAENYKSLTDCPPPAPAAVAAPTPAAEPPPAKRRQVLSWEFAGLVAAGLLLFGFGYARGFLCGVERTRMNGYAGKGPG